MDRLVRVKERELAGIRRRERRGASFGRLDRAVTTGRNRLAKRPKQVDEGEGTGSSPGNSPSDPQAADSAAPYEGLARRYRPQTFPDVVGQKHVVQTLARALDSRQWAHAYLFVGGRGLGKTTMARILAKGINCETGPSSRPCGNCPACLDIAASRDIDVLEIDAASHTGVDNVRDLIIQSVATAPARGRAKIFIIDEVHMLSPAAFNALLKTIEEPPSGIVFILATTDGHKVPATIRSRCQRFDFRPVTADELTVRLESIAQAEAFTVEPEALALLAEHAEGGVRDALSALDLVRAYSGATIARQNVEDALGLIPSKYLRELVQLLDAGDAPGAIATLGELMTAGADPGELLRGLLLEYRRQLHAQLRGEGFTSRGRIVRVIECLLGAVDRSRSSRFPRLELETIFCRIAHFREDEITLRDLYQQLQGAGSSGPVHPPVSNPDPTPPQASPATPAPSAVLKAPATASAPAPAQAKPKDQASEGGESSEETLEMLQRIFKAEVVEITKKA